MATHDYQIDNQTLADLESDLQGVIDAIASNNASDTEPAVTYPGMFWLDTSANPPFLRQRNADDNGWIIIGSQETHLGGVAQSAPVFDAEPTVDSPAHPQGVYDDTLITGNWFHGFATFGGPLLTPTYLNGWAEVSSGNYGYRIIKNMGKRVELLFYLINGSAMSFGSPLFQLPAGYRPSENLIFPGSFNYGNSAFRTCQIHVQSDGNVRVNLFASGTFMYISFWCLFDVD